MASNNVDSKRFWVRHYLCVEDVRSKFAATETVKSLEFCCREDPQPTLFRLELVFGKKVKNQLSSYLYMVNQSVTIYKMRWQVLSDDSPGNASRIGGLKNDEMKSVLDKENKGWGFDNIAHFRPITGNQAPIKWHIIFEMQYAAVSSPAPTVVSPSDAGLSEDLSKLLESGNHANVTFLLHGEKIMAHKGVLSARCSYFERMFQSDVKENLSGHIEVTDVSLEVFKELLQFLYSGQPPKFSGQETLQLLSAADKYGIEKLKKKCESLVCANLNSDIAVEALLLAKDINCVQLKEVATNFLKVNFACLVG